MVQRNFFVEIPSRIKKAWGGECKQRLFQHLYKRKRCNVRSIMDVEGEMRLVKVMVAGILVKQGQLIMAKDDLRKKCDGYQNITKTKCEIKITMDELKMENELLKLRCSTYEWLCK